MKTTRLFGITLATFIINLLICCTESNQNTGESVSMTTATQKAIPSPIGEKFQTFAEGATIADIVVVGENIKWYARSRNFYIQPGLFLPLQKNPKKQENPRTEELDSIPQNRPSPPLPLDLLLEDNKFYFATQTINGVESLNEFIVGIRLLPNIIH